MYVCELVFSGYMPGSGIVGSYAISILRFFWFCLFLLLFYFQGFKEPRYCYPLCLCYLQTFFFVDFLMMAIPSGVRQYLFIVFIFIFLIISVEHLFVFRYPSVCLWRSVYLGVCLVIELLFVVLLLSCMSYQYILEINPLLGTLFANVSPILWIVFSFYGFLYCGKAFKFIRSHLLVLLLFLQPWETDLRKQLDFYVRKCFAYVLFQEFYGVMSYIWGFPGGSDGKESAMQETQIQSLGLDDLLEKRMVFIEFYVWCERLF